MPNKSVFFNGVVFHERKPLTPGTCFGCDLLHESNSKCPLDKAECGKALRFVKFAPGKKQNSKQESRAHNIYRAALIAINDALGGLENIEQPVKDSYTILSRWLDDAAKEEDNQDK